MKPITFIFYLAILTFSIFSCGDYKKSDQGAEKSTNEKLVYKSDYGENWPFTIENGILKCISQGVVFIANGKTYAVNGTALNIASEFGYAQIDEIWAYDNSIVEQLIAAGFSKKEAEKSKVRVSLDKIIKDGLILCNQ